MEKNLIIALGTMLVLTVTPSFACTVFYASDGEMTLAGNNEDYINPLTKVWFEPAENGKYGSVFFG
ncbi:MAG: acyl-CoA--6-aminopenicillanic acid acyl-transferase, partial [bacterium]